MKVIDLLNKMANDKNYRPTVKFLTATYKYNEKVEDYENNINSDWGIFSDHTINNILNDEVELIEDEADIDNIEELDTYETVETYDWQDVDTNRMKINELVQAVNQLNKEIKSIKEK